MESGLATAAAAEQGIRFEIPTKNKEGIRFVFLAGDQLPNNLKAAHPEWTLGGALRNDALTLRYCNNYVRRCEITPMFPYMWEELASYISPERRPLMTSAYIRHENGQAIQMGKNKDGDPDGLLRHAFYPSDEVTRLTAQQDGLVEITAASISEATALQYFLFPNWDDIRNGKTALPQRSSALREYFESRLQAAGNVAEERAARASMLSCDQFQVHANTAIQAANAELQKAEAKGVGYSYGGEVDIFFAQLGVQRRDTRIDDQGSKMDKMAEAITRLAEATAPAHTTDVKGLEDEIAMLRAELQAFQTMPVDETCGGVTAAGNPCKNKAISEGYCASHATKDAE